MKFDVVVGNPPYQRPTVSGAKKNSHKPLWHEFVLQSFLLVKENGIVALLTPSSWLQFTSNIHRNITNKDIQFIKVFDKSPFKNTCTTASYWIAHNATVNNETLPVYVGDVKFDVKIGKGFIPAKSENFALRLSVINKTFGAGHQKMVVCTTMAHHSYSKAHLLSKLEDANHSNPIFHNNTTTLWSQIKDNLHQSPKVLISKTGSIKKARVDFNHSVSESAVAVVTNNMNEAKIALCIIQSRLYRFVLDSVKSTSTMPTDLLRALPSVDLTRSWTDEELYDHFNLTTEEIKLIEDTIK